MIGGFACILLVVDPLGVLKTPDPPTDSATFTLPLLDLRLMPWLTELNDWLPMVMSLTYDIGLAPTCPSFVLFCRLCRPCNVSLVYF